jgi:hypothetical protein
MKRPARKSTTPTALSVPRVRTLVTEIDAESEPAPARERAAPRRGRKRKPKFVF